MAKTLTLGSYGLTDKVFESMTETTAKWFNCIFTPSVSTIIWSSIPVKTY